MKKKLSYRDKLVELAYIYDVKEIKDYEKSRKNLTSGQLELILKKNKIVIPKDFKSNFLRDNFIKPVGRIKTNLIGTRRKLTNLQIIKSVIFRPLGSRRVLGLIHWQALKLWWKGARYRTRPEPPKIDITQ